MSGRAIVAREIGAQRAGSNERTVSGVPRMVRPTGCLGKAVSCRRSNTTSSGSSSLAPISCTMTFCSRRNSSGSKVGFGQDVGQDVERERHVGLEHARVIGGRFSTLVAALSSPPTASISSAIWRARAPLRALERHVFEQMRNAVLVRLFVAAAGADPDPERGAISRCGMRSVTTDRPEGRRVTSTLMQLLLHARRGEADETNRSTAALIRRQHGDALRPLGQIGEPVRQRRRDAAGGLDRVGKLGRMRGRQHHHRHRRIARFLLGHRQAQPRCADRRSSRPRASRCGWWRRSPPRRRDRR